METEILISKKEFKERSSIHTYGSGERRRVALFFDWSNNHATGIGYKYMLKGYGCTTKQLLDDAYNILIKNNCTELCWYDSREAKTDKDRFKVPVSM